MKMIEKVARAIEDKMGDYGTYDINELAKAAIEAMREPTDEMMEIFNDPNIPIFTSNVLAYQAMINAALKE